MNVRRPRSVGDAAWAFKAAARGVLRAVATPAGVAMVRRLRAGGVRSLLQSGGVSSAEDRRLLAIAQECCAEANRFSWYDSKFLRQFEAAKKFLAIVAPDRLDDFASSFRVLRTDRTFKVRCIEDVFDPDTFRDLVETVHSLPSISLQQHEGEDFGRALIRRHPFFTRLQASLTSRVSDLVGEAVTPTYNFLSLYGGDGRCEPHLDQPLSKWTLDICIEQTREWPIFFSQIVDWPSDSPEYGTTIEELRANRSLRFKSVTLKPNSGAIFSGSSQWHFRDPMAGGKADYCHLLFLHYIPMGTEALADSRQWARHFGIPELKMIPAADDLLMHKPASL